MKDQVSIRELEQMLAAAERRIRSLQRRVTQMEGERPEQAAAIRFRALFEHALDAILIADDDGRYVEANPAAADLFGLSREELVGMSVADFGPPEIDIFALWQAFLDSEREEGEFPIHRPDGTIRYADYAAVRDILPGRHLSILRDVTERKRVEREREQALAELQALASTLEREVERRTRAMQRRSEQLHAVASSLTVAEQRERERISRILHDDLQQLLHAAQLRVMMVEDEIADSASDEVQEMVRQLGALNERALAITRSLTVELSPPVLESEGLKEAFAWLAGHMKTVHGLTVDFVVENVELASGDLRELAFQMVRELLFNVVKHADTERARLEVCQRDGECRITVADDGKGLHTSLLDEKKSGPGYGLHHIRERLALFSGTLSVESAPGAGTKVILTLPAREPAQEDGEQRR